VGETGSVGAYQPKYKWRRTKLDDNDVPTDSDWSGYDGEVVWGGSRFRYGLKKDFWLRHLPHQGYQDEGREAMRIVEGYYDRLLEYNGISR